MNEEFLQYVWKYQLYSNSKLLTTGGESIEVLRPGTWNRDSGPDFFNAQVKLGDTTWAGNVEIHFKSSDWINHMHDVDDSYSNVILHVVLEFDQEIYRSNGQAIPTLVMTINEQIQHNFQELINEKAKPACHKTIQLVDPIYINATMHAMGIERLEIKTQSINKILERNKNDWNETFYQLLANNFGFKTNSLPFDMLSRSLPLKVLSQHTNNLDQMEALLFGQSGLLNEQLLGDDYFLKLRNEYSYLAKKYELKGIESHLWKFMRMRPANFPTVRIAQFAKLFYNSETLFSTLIEIKEIKKIIQYFRVTASPYWDTHYRFNQSTSKKTKNLGLTSQHNILINTVIPAMYLYGQRQNKSELKTRALAILEILPTEQNKIIRQWSAIGLNSCNAYDSQALIQLKNVYCDYKLCLKCQIGNKVINR